MRNTVPEGTRRFGAAFPSASTALFAVLVASVLCSTPLAGCVPERGTIGAVIAQDDESGRLFLREVPPDLAAARADLKVGDEILLIDGLDVRFMDGKQINAALVGDVDSTVKLTMIRGEQVLRVTLKRTQAQKLLSRSKKSAPTTP
ncbi:MAG: PDZ domain-containing protein [Polyangiaceae bacterium]